MTRLRRLAGLALLALVATLALAPGAAFGHAFLVKSEPFRDEVFPTGQPERVVFTFNEPVEANFGAVRVFATTADRVDVGGIFRPEGDRKQLAVKLRPGLPQGSYTATYRLVSADGHVITGGMLFHLGQRSIGGALAVSDLVDSGGPGATTSTALATVRALDYVAIALALGGLAFLLACWLPGLRRVAGGGPGWAAASEAYAKRAGLVLLAAVNLGLATSMLGILIQGAIVSGQSFWASLEANVVREVLGTRFGTVWGLKLVVWLALGGVLLAVPRTIPVLRPVSLGADGHVLARPGPLRIALLLGPAAALAVMPALSGHAGASVDAEVLIPLDVGHVAAMSVWLGGLLALVALVPAATGRLDTGDRSRLLAAVLLRFSPIALAAVGVLAVTGTIQAIEHLATFDQLWTTGFGRAVVAKAALLVLLIGLGALNRQRTVPQLRKIADDGGPPGAAGRTLKRTLRVEVGLIVAVLATTGALVGYAPPASVAATGGPFSTDVRMGPLDLTLTADPATVGNNAIHLYLFDAKTGEPFTKTKSITAQATLTKADVGPLDIALRESGPGHYVADAFAFTLKGEWSIKVVDRVSEFDEYSATVTVPIR